MGRGERIFDFTSRAASYGLEKGCYSIRSHPCSEDAYADVPIFQRGNENRWEMHCLWSSGIRPARDNRNGCGWFYEILESYLFSLLNKNWKKNAQNKITRRKYIQLPILLDLEVKTKWIIKIMIIKEEATIPQIGSFNGKEKRETEKEEAVRMERKRRKRKCSRSVSFLFFIFRFPFFIPLLDARTSFHPLTKLEATLS